MPWHPKDEDMRARIVEESAPPAEFEGLFDDPEWVDIFSAWAADKGFDEGDYGAGRLLDCWRDLYYETDGEQVWARYGPDGDEPIDWPSNVSERYDQVLNASSGDFSGALGETKVATLQLIDPYLAAFKADILAIQSPKPAKPATDGPATAR